MRITAAKKLLYRYRRRKPIERLWVAAAIAVTMLVAGVTWKLCRRATDSQPTTVFPQLDGDIAADPVDLASLESFPASDPPGWIREHV